MAYLLISLVVVATMQSAWAIDKAGILNKHNTLRGQVNPTASNMLRMYWNDNLAAAAEQFVQTCPDDHDNSDARSASVGLGISVGQNLAFNYDSWDKAIQGWYDEVKDFQYGYSGGYVLHFTQMTQALTAHIGCAYKDCTGMGGDWDTYYVCEYSYLQIDTQRPWESGAPCSKCGGSCSGNLCDCGDKLCANGGTMNTATCTCDCPGIYAGDTCQQSNCPASDPDYCGQPQPMGYERQHCDIWTNVPDECPHMCGRC